MSEITPARTTAPSALARMKPCLVISIKHMSTIIGRMVTLAIFAAPSGP
jgi:hypothetical protein